MGSHRANHRADRRTEGSQGHGHGHGHGHDAPDLEIAPGPRFALVGILAAIGLAVVVGLVLMWPSHARVEKLRSSLAFAAPGVTFVHAKVDSVQAACPVGQESPTCGNIGVTVHGQQLSVTVPPEVTHSSLGKGDSVTLQHDPKAGYSYFTTDRGGTLWLLGGLFVVVVLAVARLRGLMALVGLAIGAAVIGLFLLPALLTGAHPALASMVAAGVIMYVVLFTTHGVSLRTAAALGGTLAGVAVTALIGLLAVDHTHLTGVTGDAGGLLTTAAGHLSFPGLMTATVIVAGLGVLNDVTITQASAVWELRAASPTLSRLNLWTSAMRIGRDHIASTIYTIVFAYAGTALLTLLVIQLYDRSFFSLIGTEELSEELVRSLVSSIGLVLAVPITTAIAAVTVPGPVE